MDRHISSPTPELPMRHTSHHCRYLHPNLQPLPPLPPPADAEERALMPSPLFSKQTRSSLPPNAIHVAVFEISQFPSPSSASSQPLSSTSATKSLRSASSNFSSNSSPPTSTPSSPTSQRRSLSYVPSPIPPWWNCFDPVPLGPRHSLRRKPSPKKETLRSLRAKESDACLQRCYDSQTMSYLNGSIFSHAKAERGLERE